jgi:hypothetical protein
VAAASASQDNDARLAAVPDLTSCNSGISRIDASTETHSPVTQKKNDPRTESPGDVVAGVATKSDDTV